MLRVVAKCSAAVGELTWRVCGAPAVKLVTVSAGESFSGAVIRVTERVTIRARVRARGSIRFLIVTNSARCDLASGIRFTRRRVTRVAIVVSGDVRGDRQADAAIDRRAVTTRAASLRARRAGVVLRVIEFHVEWLVEARRKTFQRRIVAADVRVTDRAHRNLRRRELAAMTISAGFVTGKAWRCGVVGAFVTRVAGEGTVTLAVVKKFRVIELAGPPERQKCSPQRERKEQLIRASLLHLMSLRLSGGRSAIR